MPGVHRVDPETVGNLLGIPRNSIEFHGSPMTVLAILVHGYVYTAMKSCTPETS